MIGRGDLSKYLFGGYDDDSYEGARVIG